MTSPMYIQSVPVFKQMLSAMKAVLAKAEAHATAHSIEPDAYLQARLFPDMFALLKQVQIAADFARGVCARLAGVAVPANEGQEKSFADLTADEIAPKEGDVELYVNTDHPDIKRYVEVEAQGAYADIAANSSVSWQTKWFLRKLPVGVDAAPGSAALAQFVRDTIAGK